MEEEDGVRQGMAGCAGEGADEWGEEGEALVLGDKVCICGEEMGVEEALGAGEV